jgi:hypothetical protein
VKDSNTVEREVKGETGLGILCLRAAKVLTEAVHFP